MKRKIRLHRETVRLLGTVSLAHANGGRETYETCDRPCPGNPKWTHAADTNLITCHPTA